MKKTLIAIGIGMLILGVYFFSINLIHESKMIEYLNNSINNKTEICEEGWVNWSEYNESSGEYNYLPNQTYRCGFEKFEVCDKIVNKSICYLSTRYKVEVSGFATGGGESRGVVSLQEVGVSDKVSIQVIRNRWYGKIIENSNEKGITSNLYLLKNNYIELPLKTPYGIDWGEYHIGVLLIILIGIIVVFLFDFINLFIKEDDKSEKGVEYEWDL